MYYSEKPADTTVGLKYRLFEEYIEIHHSQALEEVCFYSACNNQKIWAWENSSQLLHLLYGLKTPETFFIEDVSKLKFRV